MTTEAIRKGDRFEITVEVIGIPSKDGLEGFAVRQIHTDGALSVSTMFRSELLAGRRLPRPFSVGDRVTWGGRAISYRIAAISGEWAFLDQARDEKTQFMCPDINPKVELIAELTLVEPSHD